MARRQQPHRERPAEVARAFDLLVQKYGWQARLLLVGARLGNTWKDPEAFASLFRDVNEKIFDVLPDEAWVYPGHGNDTTLGAERPHLDEWRERGW